MVFVDSHPHEAVSLASAPTYTITEYFAKSCPHCVKMEPVWTTAKADALDTLTGAKVDWVQKECYGPGWAPGKDLKYCESKGVDAFPTIILEKNGTDSQWTAPGLTGRTVAEKAEQLLKFVETKTGGDVKMQSIGSETLLASCAPEYNAFRNFM